MDYLVPLYWNATHPDEPIRSLQPGFCCKEKYGIAQIYLGHACTYYMWILFFSPSAIQVFSTCSYHWVNFQGENRIVIEHKIAQSLLRSIITVETQFAPIHSTIQFSFAGTPATITCYSDFKDPERAAKAFSRHLCLLLILQGCFKTNHHPGQLWSEGTVWVQLQHVIFQ